MTGRKKAGISNSDFNWLPGFRLPGFFDIGQFTAAAGFDIRHPCRMGWLAWKFLAWIL